MERTVIFNQYQEQQADDHNNIQEYASTSLGHLVYDAITQTRRYAGFYTQKTAQAEVQVAPGRFFDTDGAVYARTTTLVQSMVSYLAATAKKCILISVSGVVNDTDLETRDILVDVETRRMEPQAVYTTKARNAVLSLTASAESADPQPPACPVGSAPIAVVMVNNTGVLSVEMQTDYEVVSTEDLDQRALLLEAFRTAIEPRVSTLASDLAALAAKFAAINFNQSTSLIRVYQDLARLKEKADLPQTYSSYGSDNYLDVEHSDTANVGGLGYDAKISNGVGFADANMNQSEISLFSANDPNAILTNGLLLPKFTSVTKLVTGAKTSEVSISQYGYQTFNLVQKKIKRFRLRYGPHWRHWWPYPNWYHYVYGLFPNWTWATFYPWILGYERHWPHYWHHYRPYCWVETWTETYYDLETTQHTIDGAQVAQTFLIANDTWATKLGIYIAAKGGNEAIFLTLCETTNGMPDLDKVIMHMTYPHTSITVGWNYVDIVPTFMKSGGRYALVMTSNTNHTVGMTSGESYIDGTFFYSTDGQYYLGDLTKDLMLEVLGARFEAPQATIEFAPINLDGGIRTIDLLASTINPDSTELVWEVRPSGTGEWIPLTPETLAALTNAPPLFQFRGRFVGTRDMAAGVMLTGSRMEVSRPKQTFKHVSTQWTLSQASSEIWVQLTLAGFNDTPHDITCRLHYGAAYHDPAQAVIVETLDATNNIKQLTYKFTPAAITQFRIVLDGTTTSPADLFEATEMLFWAI